MFLGDRATQTDKFIKEKVGAKLEVQGQVTRIWFKV